jgi:hypothetical protein
MTDSLDSRDFYEVCQQYRHAQDAIGEPNAAEAFEQLKRWIRRNASVCATVLNPVYPD